MFRYQEGFEQMTRFGRVLKVARVATVLAIFSLSLSVTHATAQKQEKPSIIVLASTSQVQLQRAVEGVAIPGEIESSPQATVTPSVNSAPPVFVPRIRRGAPAYRIGGATRSFNAEVTIQTLVPEIDEAALTLAAQPNFHWHLSADTPHSVNFTLLDPDLIEPMVDVMLPGPFRAGFHVLSLADHQAKLESGRLYEWYIAVVPNPEKRSVDTVARGAISRVDDAALASRVAEVEPAAVAELFAGAGIWYEALDALSQGVGQSPDDASAQARRTALLEHVGLVLSQD